MAVETVRFTIRKIAISYWYCINLFHKRYSKQQLLKRYIELSRNMTLPMLLSRHPKTHGFECLTANFFFFPFFSFFETKNWVGLLIDLWGTPALTLKFRIQFLLLRMIFILLEMLISFLRNSFFCSSKPSSVSNEWDCWKTSLICEDSENLCGNKGEKSREFRIKKRVLVHEN